MTERSRVRPIFSWEFDDGTSFRVTSDADTGRVLDMIETLIALKRAELVKLSEQAADDATEERALAARPTTTG
jgi:hypothetical protein